MAVATRPVALVAGLLAAWAPGHARTPAPELPAADELQRRLAQRVSIQDMIAYAYRQNPDIAADRAAWRAKVESYRVVTALPDPQLTATYYPEPLQTRLGPQDWNLSLSQKIPFPGKLSTAGEVVRSEAHIARLKLDKTVRAVAADIHASAHELIYIRAAKGIAAQNTALLDQLRAAAETAYADDRAALLDVMKGLSQAGQLQYDALLLDELELTEMTRLNGLLNRPPDAAVGDIVPPPAPALAYGLEELYQLAAAHQEDVRMADHGMNRAAAQLDLARFHSTRTSTWACSTPASATRRPAASAGRRQGRGGRTARTEPAPVDRQEPGTREPGASRARARRGGAPEPPQRLAHRHPRGVLPAAERPPAGGALPARPAAAGDGALQTAEAWFREGYAEFTDLIEAQATLYNFQLTLARARADYGKHFARLEALVGHPLAAPGPPAAGGAKEGAEP